MHPIVRLTVDGKPMADAFFERLISITVTDKEGVASDTFSAELDDGPPNFIEMPRRGAEVEVSLGYREIGVRSLGKYTVDAVNGKCLPYGLSINGKAADLKSGKLKENKERHWEKKKLGDIIEEIAKDAKLTPKIADKFKKLEIPWLAQQDESDIHFLERIASRNNALFTIKEGHLIFSERGTGKTASGKELPAITITPNMVIEGSLTFEYNDRSKFKKVVAYYQDKKEAKRVERTADSDKDDSDGEASTYRIPDTFKNAAEADAAAESKAKKLKRGEGSCSVQIEGDPDITAGMKLVFEDVRPGLDGVEFTIETATHTYSKSAGYLLQLDGKLGEDEKSDGKPKKTKKKTGKKKGDGGAGEIV